MVQQSHSQHVSLAVQQGGGGGNGGAAMHVMPPGSLSGTYGTSLGGPAGHGRPARKGLDEACAELYVQGLPSSSIGH